MLLRNQSILSNTVLQNVSSRSLSQEGRSDNEVEYSSDEEEEVLCS